MFSNKTDLTRLEKIRNCPTVIARKREAKRLEAMKNTELKNTELDSRKIEPIISQKFQNNEGFPNQIYPSQNENDNPLSTKSLEPLMDPFLDQRITRVKILTNRACQTTSFHYMPVDENWQRMICQEKNIVFRAWNGTETGGTDILARAPSSVHDTIGDGNCLFRTISFIMSGSEDNHLEVRKALVQHMEESSSLNVSLPQLFDAHTVHEWIIQNGMRNSGTWGSQIEIRAASHWLRIPIYTFIVQFRTWYQYLPSFGEPLYHMIPPHPAIYINHPTNHFEPVLSVFPSGAFLKEQNGSSTILIDD